MRRIEDKSLGLIWYDPDKNRYEYGSLLAFTMAKKAVGEGVEVIYEIKNLTAKLAEKIVKELNVARSESNSKHWKAA